MHPAPTPIPSPRRRQLRAACLRTVVALATVVVVGLGPALPTAAVMDDAAVPRAQTSIMIMDYRYQPASPTLTVGDSVTWTNHDQAEHDVAGTSGPEALQSPMLAQGQSWTHTFGQAGAYSYICSVHPDMVASLTVNPAPTTTALPAPAPVVEVPAEAPVETGAPVPEASGAPVAAPAPGAAVPTPAPANAPTTVAGAGDPAAGSSSDELSAAPTGATEPTTDLPPLAVAGVVVAIVLATTLALFGPGTARGAVAADTEASNPDADPTAGPDEPTATTDL